MPTWPHIPGCLALGQWSQHRDYLGREDLLCAVILCILATSSQYLLLLLGPYHFCPLLSPSLHNTHSTVFLYFFALITEKGFLISPCCSLELCIQMGIPFLSPLLFTSLLCPAICKASSDSHFAFFAFLFLGDGLDPCLLYNVTNLHP